MPPMDFSIDGVIERLDTHPFKSERIINLPQKAGGDVLFLSPYWLTKITLKCFWTTFQYQHSSD